MKRARIALLAIVVSLGVMEWWASPKDVPLLLASDIAAGWALCVAGVIASGDGRPRTIAVLLEAAGVAWLIGGVVPPLLDVYRGPFVHVLLAYPSGRVVGRVPRTLVVLAYLDGPFGQLPQLRAASTALFVAVAVLAAWAAVRASGSGARGRTTAAGAAIAVAAIAVVLTAGPSMGLLDPDAGRLAYSLVVGCVGIVLAADVRWGGWSRAAVARLVIELGDRDEPATLRRLLADALTDKSLVIGFAAGPAGSYVDEAGRAVALPAPGSDRQLTFLNVDNEPVGILIRDGTVETDEGLIDGVAAAAELALTNAVLQADIRERIRSVAASRRRLVEAADSERSRIERELEDGVGRRLAKAEWRLTEIANQRRPAGTTRALIHEIHAVRADLRQLTQGIGSPGLLANGLRAAVAELARRSPVPIEVDIPTTRWPMFVERAAYFVCSEGVANATKHAHGSAITVRAWEHAATLELEVIDDGIGGADPAGGSGLRGLTDRLEAVGGSFAVEDRRSGGTRLVASLPLRNGLDAS